jgi:hypothetical protein
MSLDQTEHLFDFLRWHTRKDSISDDISNILNKKSLDIFSVKNLSYSDRIRNLDVESVGEVKSTKFFPVFLNESWQEQIFKPLSKTKPFLTPLFAYAEVFRSYVIHTYFDEKAPTYQLAICDGISEDIPKYYTKWTLVNSVLQKWQKLTNLLEYFRNNPDPNVDIDTYINYCMETYDYIPILKSSLFTNDIQLTENLVNQILLSILMKNQNFHYENIAFIYEWDSLISLAPPIDHEFSSFFLFPEDIARYSFHDTLYDMSMTKASWNLFQNILFIVQNYPTFVKNFSDRLQKFKADLLETKIVLGNWKYIWWCNSDDYTIWHARFKSNNEEEANLLEQKIEKYSIDIFKYENFIKLEILKHIEVFQLLLENANKS